MKFLEKVSGIFFLIALIGVFSLTEKVYAQTTDDQLLDVSFNTLTYTNGDPIDMADVTGFRLYYEYEPGVPVTTDSSFLSLSADEITSDPANQVPVQQDLFFAAQVDPYRLSMAILAVMDDGRTSVLSDVAWQEFTVADTRVPAIVTGFRFRLTGTNVNITASSSGVSS